MPYESTRQLKEDVLFRASESLGGSSGWEGRIVDYINRNYREIATGASAFLPEFVDDWWWMREASYFMMEPVFQTGLITVTQNSDVAVLSEAPQFDVSRWKLRVRGQQVPDIFEVIESAAANPVLKLDAPYTGTSAVSQFFLMKVNYNPNPGVNPQVLIGPMRTFRGPERIYGLGIERMEELWPLSRLMPGVPQAFAIINELPGVSWEVRFSHGGLTNNVRMRVDYLFRPVLDDLIDTVDSIPKIPLQWRHILADMALVGVLLDKNDDRANAAALGARTTLAAMLKENRRRSVKIDFNAGHIFPRGGVGDPEGKLIRTESGLIIG
jgi:hypothetical protein